MITRKDQDETDVRAAHGNAGHRERAAFKEWSEGRYEDLAESMPQIVWTADGAGNVTYHNKRWSDLVAEGEDDSRRAGAHAEVDGRAPPRRRRSYPPAVTPSSKAFQFATIAHPNDLASFALGWSTAVKAGVEWEAELRLGSPSVGYRFHLVRAVPRTDGNGNVLAWVGTATDIDARVRADRALRMLADASKILNRSHGNGADAARTLAIIDVEMVLRSALPIFGDGAVLHLRGSELGTSKGAPTLGLDGGQRVQVTGVALDAGVLADPRFELGPATVACTGRAEVHLDVERESSQLSSSFEGRVEEHLRFLDEVGVSAYICVPLVSRDRSLGALTFMRCGVGERYEDADVEVAADLAGRIAVAIDNTWLLRMSERRREELELANESKDVFLATLSHELRTPLNAIVGWTDMMRTGALAPHELARAIETIDRNAHSLSGLVGDLLDVSRIVTGTLKLESKPVSLVSVIESAIVAARPQCASKDITLELTIKKVASVLGDPLRLRQVVNNLLSNAIKFTPPGGRISVRLQTADERVVHVVVSDTGEGIASDFLPHVFERFRQEQSNHRGSTATGMARLPRSMQAGLGLGLAIVKHLVEEHGGKVSATSDGRGKGASFTIELPALDGAAAREEVEDRASLPSVGEPDLSGVHVLIVEDDPDGNELICTILERYGARVTATTSAAAALDALDVERPQVLVSDIGLPDMDGMDLIRAIRKRAEDGAIPAIALTAYASRQDATKALAAGFDAHVAKPVQPSTLGVVIVRLLARSGAALGEPGASRGAAARASCQ